MPQLSKETVDLIVAVSCVLAVWTVVFVLMRRREP